MIALDPRYRSVPSDWRSDQILYVREVTKDKNIVLGVMFFNE